MTILAIVVFWFIAGVVAVQAVLGLGFVFALRKRDPLVVQRFPKTAVILSLRGPDPFLERCIRALLEQDYPDFDVRIVVDDENDPAWSIVHRTLKETGAAHVVAGNLKSPGNTCSLKCSSVAQAISELDDSIEVVALLDADTIAHSTWLRELVAPLEDPSVGAATGNRWYMPDDASVGSLVRYSWNAAAVTIMYWCRIAWGGSLAVKRSVIEQADLLTHWRNAFCEDTMLFSMLRRHGLRQVFVPTLMMVNRENCSLVGVRRWISRQLLTARLYHPGWIVTVSHCLVSACAPLLSIGIFIAACLASNREAATWALGGFAMLQIAWIVLLLPVEFSVRRVVRSRGERTNWLTPKAIAMLTLAIVMTQVIYPGTLLRAIFLRTIEWRGVQYTVGGPWKIRLLAHVPFRTEPQSNEQHSL